MAPSWTVKFLGSFSLPSLFSSGATRALADFLKFHFRYFRTIYSNCHSAIQIILITWDWGSPSNALLWNRRWWGAPQEIQFAGWPSTSGWVAQIGGWVSSQVLFLDHRNIIMIPFLFYLLVMPLSLQSYANSFHSQGRAHLSNFSCHGYSPWIYGKGSYPRQWLISNFWSKLKSLFCNGVLWNNSDCETFRKF